jgi:predicted ATPase
VHLKSVTLHPERFPTHDVYPFNLPVFHRKERLVFDTPVTLFVGENGTGKSTLLEALARKCGIHIWRYDGGRRYRYNPFEEQFHEYISIEWRTGQVPGSFFGAQIFHDFAQILDEWAASDPGQLEYFGGKSLMAQSHGQSLMSYFKSRYKLRGLYLLDEPETGLSPKSQLELLEILADENYTGKAQFIIATHSPLLLACPGAVIYSYGGERIEAVRYEDTEHYRIYKRFMVDHYG